MEQYPRVNIPYADGYSGPTKGQSISVPNNLDLEPPAFMLDYFWYINLDVPNNVGHFLPLMAFRTKVEANQGLCDFRNAKPSTWRIIKTGVTADGMEWVRFTDSALGAGDTFDMRVWTISSNPNPLPISTPRRNILPATITVPTMCPTWAYIYEPGHLKDLEPPLKSDVYESLPFPPIIGKMPYRGIHGYQAGKNRPTWAWIQYQLLARVPGGEMHEEAMLGMAQEWISSVSGSAKNEHTLREGFRFAVRYSSNFIECESQARVWRLANLGETK